MYISTNCYNDKTLDHDTYHTRKSIDRNRYEFTLKTMKNSRSHVGFHYASIENDGIYIVQVSIR